MELLFLMCVAIAAFATKAKVDSTAYANGKEPASVAKARMRHEAGGGARSATGKPKGPGALRLLLASRWANACEASKQRGEHKAARRRAWYEETAPLKDEEWRRKKLARLDKADRLRNRWAVDRGLVDLDEYRERREQRIEDEAWAENERRDLAVDEQIAPGVIAGTAPLPSSPDFPIYPPNDLGHCSKCDKPMSAVPGSFQADEGDGSASVVTKCWDCSLESSHNWALTDAEYRHYFGGQKNDAEDAPASCAWPDEKCTHPRAQYERFCAGHVAELRKSQAGARSSYALGLDAADYITDSPRRHRPEAEKGTADVYQQAAQQLIAAADQVAEYRADLAAFADNLDGKQWGVEVTGPVKDMDTDLTRIEGDYRDLAAQITHQGDQGAAAYDQAPWVPGPDAVMA